MKNGVKHSPFQLPVRIPHGAKLFNGFLKSFIFTTESSVDIKGPRLNRNSAGDSNLYHIIEN